MTTLKETIKEITYKHLKEHNGLCFGQNLSAVGWLQGTLPELYEKDGMIELPTSDCSNAGVAVGAALMGRKSIYCIRFAGFSWLNASYLINYAAKSKEMWGKPCKMLVRIISRSGGIGPVASNSVYSLFYNQPGIKMFCPMDSYDWEEMYKEFMNDDCVYISCEHAQSYSNEELFFDLFVYPKWEDIVLVPIGVTAFEAIKAKEKLKDKVNINIIRPWKLKPFDNQKMNAICNSQADAKFLVIGDEYENGMLKSIAYDIQMRTKNEVHVLGLPERTAGFHKSVDVLPPSCDDIVKKVEEIIK